MNGPTGYIHDPHRVAEVIQQRSERGDAVYASAFSDRIGGTLAGTWKQRVAAGVTGVFLRDREVAVRGTYRRPFLQRFGTCVARGLCRGVQLGADIAIADRLEVMKPVEISFAPIYSMARHEIGRDRCGSGDGAILADAAQAVHDLGVATTELFAGMTENQVEVQAVRFAAPGVGTPKQWLAAAAGHTCNTFAPDSLELLFDCIAAGYAVPYAHKYVTAKPNMNGISDLGSFGPHCRCFVGVFLDDHGETQLESCESWGRFPAGDSQDADQTMPIDQIPRITLHYGGGEKQLAPGNVGVKARRFWDQIQSGGEAWAVGAPKYLASTLTEVQKPYLGAV